ncbi:MBG domain-containing protein [Flammeovirga sp. SubArs3]|uniref:MBG domain-containing protein n=1 Tax=Flammeovirga sp. SubArs3 TaxID=2995316 RepID=UPI00248D1D56|nr:MBG domain-containing protein [Flammeovirga sp. SubArs3]
MKIFLLNLLTITFLFSFTQASLAEDVTGDVIYVDATSGNDSNDGTELSPLKSLTKALSTDHLQQKVATIIYVKGTFTEDKNITLKGSNNSTSRYDVTIKSWGDEQAVFQGDKAYGARFMKIQVTDMVFENVTIRDFGNADNGGALFIDWSANVEIRSCNIIGNKALYNASKKVGGGAIHTAGFLKVYDSYFAENFSEDKGAAISVALKDLTMENTLIYNNSTNAGGTEYGGAIMVAANDKNDANLKMNNTTIVGNYSNFAAGGAAGIILLDHWKGPKANILEFRNNLLYNYVAGKSQNWSVDLFAKQSRIIEEAQNLEYNILNVKNSTVEFGENSTNQVISNIFDEEDPELIVKNVKEQMKVGTSLAVDENGAFVLPKNDKGVYYLPIYFGSVAIDNGYNTGTNDIVGNAAIGGGKDVGQYEFSGSPATIKLTSASEIEYTGEAIDTPTFSIEDEGGNDISGEVTLTVTYNDGADLPLMPGVYTVKATLDVLESGFNAELVTEITVTKQSAAITLTTEDLSATYDGTEKTVGVTSDYNYTITYQEGEEDPTTTAPVNAGEYKVVASIDETLYQGEATATLTIDKATVTLSETSTTATYNAMAQSYGFKITGAADEDLTDVVNADVTYDSETEDPVDAKAYAVVVTVNDMNYKSDATLEGTFTIEKAAVEFTVGEDKSFVYNGEEQTPEITVTPEVDFDVEISGEDNTLGIDVAEYTATATITDPNYEGSVAVDYEITKATATIQLFDLVHLNDGNVKAASYKVLDGDGEEVMVTVNLTYSQEGEEVVDPKEGGDYMVYAEIDDKNFEGSNEAEFIISSKMTTDISVEITSVVYNGSSQAVVYSVADESENAIDTSAGTVTVTYNDAEEVPSDAGTYQVKITYEDDTYYGFTSFDYEITKQEVTITKNLDSFVYNEAVQLPTYTLSMDALNVMEELTSGNGTDAGDHQLKVMINEVNYQGELIIEYTIEKAPISVALSDLSYVYDASEKSATVVLGKEGLMVDVMYNDVADLPMNAGEYAVKAMINETNYQGEAEATLTIEKAEATVEAVDLAVDFDGQPKTLLGTPSIEGLSVVSTYNGSTEAPTIGGEYAVVTSIDDQNYQGSATATLTINKIEAALSFTTLEGKYDGTMQYAEAAGEVEFESITYSYMVGEEEAEPINVGEYTVVATINDPSYFGSLEGTFVVNKGTTTITFADLEHQFDFEEKEATITTSEEVDDIFVTYNGSTSLPTLPGEYVVAVAVIDDNYEGFALDTLVIFEEVAEPTAIDDTTFGVSVYPNPSNGQFTVSLNDVNEAELSVINLSGVAVYTSHVVQQSVVDLQNVVSGVYIVKLVSGDQVSTSKIYIK